MNWIAALILLLCLAGPASAQAPVWPNEPAGFTINLDCPMANLSACSIQNPYNAGLIVNDSTDPVSPPSAYRSRIEAGEATGGTELHWYPPATVREMYVGIIWRTNPEFQGRIVGNKTFFMRGPNYNGVFLFGNSSLNNGSAPMIFAHNTGIVDGVQINNSHVCAFALGEACYPNMSSGLLTVGTVHKLEAYIKCSTTATSQDGTVRWWINGVLAGNYTTLNYCHKGMNEWVWSETWDGSTCCFLGGGVLPTVPWEHYLGHLHISSRVGGGGVVPPPPPGDAVPGRPAAVTGVSATVTP